MLCRLAPIRQASFFHGVVLSRSASLDDVLVPAKVYIGRREVAEALMVPVVVVIGDENLDQETQNRSRDHRQGHGHWS